MQSFIVVVPDIPGNLGSGFFQREGHLTSVIELSLKVSIEQLLSQDEFIAMGLVSRDHARITGRYADARSVFDELSSMLAEEKQKRS